MEKYDLNEVVFGGLIRRQEVLDYFYSVSGDGYLRFQPPKRPVFLRILMMSALLAS